MADIRTVESQLGVDSVFKLSQWADPDVHWPTYLTVGVSIPYFAALAYVQFFISRDEVNADAWKKIFNVVLSASYPLIALPSAVFAGVASRARRKLEARYSAAEMKLSQVELTSEEFAGVFREVFKPVAASDAARVALAGATASMLSALQSALQRAKQTKTQSYAERIKRRKSVVVDTPLGRGSQVIAALRARVSRGEALLGDEAVDGASARVTGSYCSLM